MSFCRDARKSTAWKYTVSPIADFAVVTSSGVPQRELGDAPQTSQLLTTVVGIVREPSQQSIAALIA
jgi:hypothetical protein